MLSVLAILVAGAVVAFAADQLVVGSARWAANLSVSPVVVGGVVIGFGTSIPELTVAISAATRGNIDLATGSIVGSNIMNVTLALGVAAVISPIAISSRSLRREAPFATGAVILFAVLIWLWPTKIAGALLLGVAVASIWFLVRSARTEREEVGVEVEEFFDEASSHRTWVEAFRAIAGLAGVLIGVEVLIRAAAQISRLFGISEAVIAMTVVAVGTSIPELVTAIQAARRNEAEIVVGDLLGSNLFNSLVAGGCALLIGGGPIIDSRISERGGVAMVAAAVAAFALMARGKKIWRWEGGLLVGLFTALIAVATL